MPIYVVTWNNWWVQCTYWLTIAQKSQIPRAKHSHPSWAYDMTMTHPRSLKMHSNKAGGWPRWRSDLAVAACLTRSMPIENQCERHKKIERSSLAAFIPLLPCFCNLVQLVTGSLGTSQIDASHCGITDKLWIYIYIYIWHADVCITMSILYLLCIYICIYIYISLSLSLSRHIYIYTYVVYACSILLQWSPTCRSIIGCTWIIVDLHWWCGFICSLSRLQNCSSCISALFFWYGGRKATQIILLLQH